MSTDKICQPPLGLAEVGCTSRPSTVSLQTAFVIHAAETVLFARAKLFTVSPRTARPPPPCDPNTMTHIAQSPNVAVLPPIGARDPVLSVLAEWNGRRRAEPTQETYGLPFGPSSTR